MCSILLTLLLWLSPEANISLLTCSPGKELYARYGHSAIRVEDPDQGIDYVFNYGLFSFEESHFYWRFVKGETWYQLGVQDYAPFVWSYRHEGRQVVEQRLKLSEQQKDSIFVALMVNARPENRTYLYNFVFDNCATRPYHIIQNALGGNIRSSYTGWEGSTYRDFIHHFTRHGSWAEFGIDLIFGYKADRTISGDERLFLPEALMLWMQEAYLPNGEALVGSTSQQVNESTSCSFQIEPVEWYESWYFGLALLTVILVWLNWFDRRRGKRSKWLDWALYILYALMATLLIFLIFFSIHPLVSIGWRVFFVPFIHLCTRQIYFWR